MQLNKKAARRAVAVVAMLIASTALVYAATVSFNITTTAQDTYIQTTLIPEINTELCAKFGLPSNCTGAQLTTAGCVAAPANAVTKSNLVYQNCTPFTLDATGENNLAADLFARELVAKVANDKASDIAATCAAFKAATTANQNSVCTTLGRPAGCLVC